MNLPILCLMAVIPVSGLLGVLVNEWYGIAYCTLKKNI